jgi:folate-dependent phosphoribosylglycinamide formyltransferase PurN
MTARIGWFTTARGPGSRGMYEAVAGAVAAGEIDAEFACVFTNRDPGEDEVTDGFFELVRSYGHPLVTRSSVRYRRSVGGKLSRPGEPLPAWREHFDALVAEDLEAHPFDVGMMAGYMLIFTAGFVRSHPILNQHPALPDGPRGTWREVIRALIRGDAAESGVMLHLAIPEVDEGPVVAYCRYPLHSATLDPLWAELARGGGADGLDDAALEATPLFAAIREEGMRYEPPLVLATLAEFGTGELRVEGARVVDSRGASRQPADLTHAVLARAESTGR